MATQKVVVEGSNVSASQMKDFWRQIEDGSINRFTLQKFLDHQNPFDLENVEIDWAKVYDVLGMKKEFAEEFPKLKTESRAGLWSVPVLKGVTPNKVVQATRALGVTVDMYVEDLDVNVPTNERDPAQGSYLVSFQKTVEADLEEANKSADMLAEEKPKKNHTTLLERLLLGLGYFITTGTHLDIENVTLCAGSRYSGGCVPGVDWHADDRRVFVDWYGRGYRHPFLRSRAVVS